MGSRPMRSEGAKYFVKQPDGMKYGVNLTRDGDEYSRLHCYYFTLDQAHMVARMAAEIFGEDFTIMEYVRYGNDKPVVTYHAPETEDAEVGT